MTPKKKPFKDEIKVRADVDADPPVIEVRVKDWNAAIDMPPVVACTFAMHLTEAVADAYAAVAAKREEGRNEQERRQEAKTSEPGSPAV